VPERHQVVIVGSGPAGLTAAIYTARANLNPLVIEGEPSSTSDQPGGQLMLTTEVENYPGFVDGILGPELMQRFRGQAERFGAQFVMAKATRLELSTGRNSIWTGDPDAAEPDIEAEALIIASGAKSLLLGVPGEARLLGYGVSTCATCDGFFFKEKDSVVVGGGDSALEEALFLTRFGRSVTLVHRRAELRASKIMQDRAFANDKISFRWNSVVLEVLGESKVDTVKLKDVVTGDVDELPAAGVFVAIGHEPNTSVLAGQLELDENGYVKTFGGTTTSIEGVFACGDVQDHIYRQAVTASGSGCMAAIDAERWLDATEAARAGAATGAHAGAPVE
jgi:thioredoxin reductase (NADPH)